MDLESFLSGPAIILAYILIVGGAVMAIVVPIITALISNPKSLLKGLAGVLIIGVLLFIGYSMSGNELPARYIEYNVKTPEASQWIGGVITLMYILLGIAITSVVAGFVLKIVR